MKRFLLAALFALVMVLPAVPTYADGPEFDCSFWIQSEEVLLERVAPNLTLEEALVAIRAVHNMIGLYPDVETYDPRWRRDQAPYDPSVMDDPSPDRYICHVIV